MKSADRSDVSCLFVMQKSIWSVPCGNHVMELYHTRARFSSISRSAADDAAGHTAVAMIPVPQELKARSLFPFTRERPSASPLRTIVLSCPHKSTSGVCSKAEMVHECGVWFAAAHSRFGRQMFESRLPGWRSGGARHAFGKSVASASLGRKAAWASGSGPSGALHHRCAWSGCIRFCRFELADRKEELHMVDTVCILDTDVSCQQCEEETVTRRL
jgi:hypothetical protein